MTDRLWEARGERTVVGRKVLEQAESYDNPINPHKLSPVDEPTVFERDPVDLLSKEKKGRWVLASKSVPFWDQLVQLCVRVCVWSTL